ncbi:WD40-repeat-containing domain protein [Gamsiella multidivaricata]|uniref:WD40-repeat-containing domain protein n=1 Tax=Gamsiella multidivaricata TaxID=101098 RepID=UPI00221E531E|nr:WD40-repeat-containing domain protein [Gamsiella multidivaricata]KAI7825699.1 WD40-repeat-containing domain protein [Gamsiella multidivaricata]
MKNIVLQNTPAGTISCMAFHPIIEYLLLVASWDGTVSLYDIRTNVRTALYQGHKGPVLTCCWGQGYTIFSAGVDGRILVGSDKWKEKRFGKHEDTITSLAYCRSRCLLVSGSSDKTARIWSDYTSLDIMPTTRAHEFVFEGPVDSLDISHDMLVVAVNQEYHIFNIGVLNASAKWVIPSALTCRTRVMKLSYNGYWGAFGSVEGRVLMKNMQDSTRDFLLMVSRNETVNPPSIFPMNAIAFHPVYHTFVTGSSNGWVASWDQFNIKKLAEIVPAASSSSLSANLGPVSALAYSCRGEYLAIATGDTFDSGPSFAGPATAAAMPRTTVVVRPMVVEKEVRPITKN